MNFKKSFPLIATMLFASLFIVAQNEIIISGTLKNAETGLPMEGAEIAFMDENNLRLYVRSTDFKGEFKIETNLQPGQIIIIEASKQGFETKRIFHTIRNKNIPGGNLVDINLFEGIGIIISGFVLDEKSRKPIRNAKVSFIHKSGRKMDGGMTDYQGFFSFFINQKAGEKVVIHIDKSDDYREKVLDYVIPEHKTPEWIFLKKKEKFKTEWYPLGGGALLFGASMITGNASDKAYDRSLQTINPNRQEDLDKANNLKRTSAGTFYASAATIGAGIVIWAIAKSKQKKRNRNSRTGMLPLYKMPTDLASAQVGILLTF